MHLISMKHFICLSLCCLLAMSCVETIVMDSKEEKPVVVYCVLNDTTSVQRLELYYASSLAGEGMTPVPEEDVAAVVLHFSDPEYPFIHQDGALWTCSHPLIQGKEYVLTIFMEDGRTFEGTTRVPKMEPFGFFHRKSDLFGIILDHYYTGLGSIEGKDPPYDDQVSLWTMMYQPIGKEKRYCHYLCVSKNTQMVIPGVHLGDFACYDPSFMKQAGWTDRAIKNTRPMMDLPVVEWAIRDKYIRNSAPIRETTSLLGEYDLDAAIKQKVELNFPPGVELGQPILMVESHYVSPEYDAFLTAQYKKRSNILAGDVLSLLKEEKEFPSNITGTSVVGVFGSELICRTVSPIHLLNYDI